MTLLYVEDEQELSELMSDLLEDEVKTLWIAKNGEEGLAMFEQYRPDIVMSDIYMPKVDGLSMSERIKEAFPDTPVVLLTAFTNPEDMKRAIEIGIDRYINKPVKSQEQLEKPLNAMAKRVQEHRDLEALSKQIADQSKYAAMGEVIGHITHQWKQPLSVIAARITAMQMKKEIASLEEDDVDTLMRSTMEQVDFLTKTISDFRDFLKPKEETAPFALEKCFSKVKSLIGSVLKNKGVTLEVPETDVRITGLENKLVHVLVNIINNACDAMVESEARIKQVRVSVESPEGNCIIRIADTGGGIDASVLPNIFEPYFTTKDEEKGTGLGLYMSREFIHGHMGGKLTVTNEQFEVEGETCSGAVFTITLPMEMAE
jgi:signal transduction histidine kinase